MISKKEIEEKLYSFSSANTFPMKILLNQEIIHSALVHNKLPSIHLQLNPTNKCNFDCLMCSCSERERELELTLEEIDKVITSMHKYGLKAVTITGGGEPLMHPEINEIINVFYESKVEVGIVTNGSLLNRIDKLDKVTWVRISASDYLKSQLNSIGNTINRILYDLKDIVCANQGVDWSFSYVLSKDPDLHLLEKLIKYANEFEFTHFRLVNDIFIADQLTKQMEHAKNYMRSNYVDDSLVNYQDRSEWTTGYNPCYISILKPVIGADGYIYPCCGTQYALETPSRDYEKLMRMGTINNIEDVLLNQWFFDGSICHKCYYGNYNRVLRVLMNGLKHKVFV